MKKKFEAIIWELMEAYSKEKQVPNMWEKPVSKFAASEDPKFLELRELVVPDHYVPTD